MTWVCVWLCCLCVCECGGGLFVQCEMLKVQLLFNSHNFNSEYPIMPLCEWAFAWIQPVSRWPPAPPSQLWLQKVSSPCQPQNRYTQHPECCITLTTCGSVCVFSGFTSRLLTTTNPFTASARLKCLLHLHSRLRILNVITVMVVIGDGLKQQQEGGASEGHTCNYH